MIAINPDFPHSLRLYNGDADDQIAESSPPKTERDWTIREAFEGESRELLQRFNRAPGTVAKWEKAIWYWEECFSDPIDDDNPYPPDPPISEIKRAQLDAFPERILEPARGLSIKTTKAANQQLMYINAILSACTDHLDAVPKGRPLASEAATRHRRIISDSVLTDLYFATDTATYCTDRRLPAPLVFRSLVVLLCSIGCRRSEAVMMPADALVRSVEFPEGETGIEIDAASPHGWLVFHTPKTKRRKNGLPLVLPCSRYLRDHLDELNRLAPGRERMFPLGNHPSTWRAELRRIHAACEVDRPYSFQEFRKTANRRFRRAADRDVARFMLGHQPRGVNASFYDDMTADAVAMLARVDWPRGFDSFTSPLSTPGEPIAG